MKALLTITVAALMALASSFGQVSYFNQGFLRQPSQAADLAYLGITSTGIPSFVVTNTETGVTLGGTFTGTFSGTYNTALNGILQGNGVTMGTVTIGAGLSYIGTTLSASGGAGTVTAFSSGNLSPLFTTSVANPNTTPALSFAQVSQNANLVFASPDGAPGNPSFRALTSTDIPRTVFTDHVDVVTSTLQPGDIMAYNGSKWTNGPPSTNGIGSISLPGLLTRPVSADASGIVSAPTWPDDSVYRFDEEFDSYTGTSSGQFGKNFWSFTSAGGGGGINLSTTNESPHFGMVILSSPTGANTSSSIEQFASSLQPPYPSLGTNPNWLYHSVVRLATSNVGSIYRIGLCDVSFAAIAQSLAPSNCIVVRWDKSRNDPNNFIFEACSNATRTLANSTVRPNTNNWIDITMFSTNAGTALCAINGEDWVTLTNIPTAPVGIVFTTAVTNGVTEFLWIDRVSFMASSLSR